MDIGAGRALAFNLSNPLLSSMDFVISLPEFLDSMADLAVSHEIDTIINTAAHDFSRPTRGQLTARTIVLMTSPSSESKPYTYKPASYP